jgi:hypothetical protein
MGLKKCLPRSCLGLALEAGIAAILNGEALVASSAGGGQISSNRLKRPWLAASDSEIASTTTCPRR